MRAIALLTVSNIFMTFAWYGHLWFKHASSWKVVEELRWNYLVGFGLMAAAAVFFIFKKW